MSETHNVATNLRDLETDTSFEWIAGIERVVIVQGVQVVYRTWRGRRQGGEEQPHQTAKGAHEACGFLSAVS